MLLLLCLALGAADPKVELLSKPDAVREVIAARKGKVVVVKFWATWCDSCVKQFPEFVRTAKRFPTADVDVFTVSVDPKEMIDKLVVPTLRKQQVPFVAYLLDLDDPAPLIAALDKTWEGTLPATFVFDRAGVLKKRFDGETPGLEAQVTALLKH